MKALVLAAGLGTRLRPLTDHLPKPLIPVLNQPLMEVALRRLKARGFGPFAVNAHHLAEKIQAFVKQKEPCFGELVVSLELPEILGSGGVFPPLKAWLKDDDVLVYNGDILSDIDFAALKTLHQKSRGQNLVTLAVKPSHNGLDRAVWIQHQGGKLLVKSISKVAPPGEVTTAYTFAGAYITSSKLLSYLPAGGPSDVIEAFQKALADGHSIEAMPHGGFWADVGNPQSLWQTSFDIHALPSRERLELLAATQLESLYKAEDSHISATARLSGLVVVGSGAVIEDGTFLTDVIMMPGSKASVGQNINRMILGPRGVKIAF